MKHFFNISWLQKKFTIIIDLLFYLIVIIFYDRA